MGELCRHDNPLKKKSPALEVKALDKKNRGFLSALSLFTQLGLTMAVCVFVGVMAGKLLDGFLGTSPWLLFLFAVFGVGAAIKCMFELISKEWKNLK
ncbi:MAG: AtpZ/AtpI family protein [Clostridiales bacterium]|nr:AtpZ/AtpI family protein [Clostridiales bacterium]